MGEGYESDIDRAKDRKPGPIRFPVMLEPYVAAARFKVGKWPRMRVRADRESPPKSVYS
mgnify:CR=1 FL=1|tara:strand:- start:1014 stop:1190 length:177 start_codon:yes stop_codon:yes gene_type:complete